MIRRKANWMVAAFLGLTVAIPLGCDDGQSEKQDVSALLGTWGVSAGNLALVCFGMPQSQTISGNLVISDKSNGVLQLSFADSTLAGCNMLLDAQASSATIRKGQTCQFAASGFVGTLNVDTGSLVKSGEAATLNLMGTVAGNFNNIPINCTANFTSTLVRGGIVVPDGGVGDTLPATPDANLNPPKLDAAPNTVDAQTATDTAPTVSDASQG